MRLVVSLVAAVTLAVCASPSVDAGADDVGARLRGHNEPLGRHADAVAVDEDINAAHLPRRFFEAVRAHQQAMLCRNRPLRSPFLLSVGVCVAKRS